MEKEKHGDKDEKIKEFCRDRSMMKAAEVGDFLEKVSLDEGYTDVKMVRQKNDLTGKWGYKRVRCPVPVNVRVMAAKTWKEMFFDKAIGDVKEKAKEARRGGIDMKAALEAVGKARQEAKVANKENLA